MRYTPMTDRSLEDLLFFVFYFSAFVVAHGTNRIYGIKYLFVSAASLFDGIVYFYNN